MCEEWGGQNSQHGEERQRKLDGVLQHELPSVNTIIKPTGPKIEPSLHLKVILAEIPNRQQRETLCILGGVDHCDFRS
jgi:hypothetical protein